VGRKEINEVTKERKNGKPGGRKRALGSCEAPAAARSSSHLKTETS